LVRRKKGERSCNLQRAQSILRKEGRDTGNDRAIGKKKGNSRHRRRGLSLERNLRANSERTPESHPAGKSFREAGK